MKGVVGVNPVFSFNKRALFIATLVWGLFIVALPMGSAVPEYARIVLLDREPFYSPPTVTILPGQSVEWQSRAGQPHTITHDGCARGAHCAFHSGHLHPGERFAAPILAPGTYPYHCNIHPFMRGVVVVKKRSVQSFGATEL